MNYNYHTHTYRCGHATGTEREYIEKAIASGIKKMGFSEHIPLVLPDGTEYYYRLKTAQKEDYIKTLLALKEEYKNKIEIHIGYETEYYTKFFEDMVKSAKEEGIEYLILGQHCVGYDKGCVHWVTEATEDEEVLTEYTGSIIKAIKTGYITYVAHPDMINFVGDDKIYEREMKRLCIAAKENNIPLELNFLGIRNARNYPNEKFWEIAGREGAAAVFGFDAHDVDAAGDTKSLERAQNIIKKYNVCLLCDVELRKL